MQDRALHQKHYCCNVCLAHAGTSGQPAPRVFAQPEKRLWTILPTKQKCPSMRQNMNQVHPNMFNWYFEHVLLQNKRSETGHLPCDVLSHSSAITSCSSSIVDAGLASTRLARSFHRLSIGLRSGECAGKSSRLIPLLRSHVLTRTDLCFSI